MTNPFAQLLDSSASRDAIAALDKVTKVSHRRAQMASSYMEPEDLSPPRKRDIERDRTYGPKGLFTGWSIGWVMRPARETHDGITEYVCRLAKYGSEEHDHIRVCVVKRVSGSSPMRFTVVYYPELGRPEKFMPDTFFPNAKKARIAFILWQRRNVDVMNEIIQQSKLWKK